jgi:hypothetical protein
VKRRKEVDMAYSYKSYSQTKVVMKERRTGQSDLSGRVLSSNKGVS